MFAAVFMPLAHAQDGADRREPNLNTTLEWIVHAVNSLESYFEGT